MALLGFGDLKDQTIHALWDLAELKRLELRDGTTFDQMVTEVQDAANAVSGELLSAPHYSSLFSVQDTPDLEYGVYTGGGIQEMTEYSVPDPFRGKTTGHMLPIKMFNRTLGWTFLALENRRRTQLQADIQVVVTDIRDHYQQRMLQKFFTMEASKVNDTAGASVPFADGGTSDSNYVPLQGPEGQTFANTHDHYVRYTAVSNANNLLMVQHLTEHGHQPPFDLCIAQADIATYRALTEWRAPEWQGIIYRDSSSGTDRAALDGIQLYDGYLETAEGIVRVWTSPRVPTTYSAMWKAYGVGDARNPMRMRIDPLKGYGWSVVPGNYVNAPLTLVALRSEWDAGVGDDRTNGVFCEIDSAGDYATPTIS
jgi:hypothetical protein